MDRAKDNLNLTGNHTKMGDNVAGVVGAGAPEENRTGRDTDAATDTGPTTTMELTLAMAAASGTTVVTVAETGIAGKLEMGVTVMVGMVGMGVIIATGEMGQRPIEESEETGATAAIATGDGGMVRVPTIAVAEEEAEAPVTPVSRSSAVRRKRQKTTEPSRGDDSKSGERGSGIHNPGTKKQTAWGPVSSTSYAYVVLHPSSSLVQALHRLIRYRLPRLTRSYQIAGSGSTRQPCHVPGAVDWTEMTK